VSNYTKSTNFATKDTLPSSDPLKIVRGTEIDAEFNAIATAVATKSDSISPTFTGTVTVAALTASGAATFTTLSASSTVSGAGFSTYLASPPAIGGTAAAAGSFTSVTTPSVTNAGTLALTATGANIITASTNGTERMRIDSSGNVCVGTTTAVNLFTVSGPSVIATFNSTNNANVIGVSNASTIGGYIGATGTNLILANNSGTEGVRLDASSNLQFNSGYGSVATAYGCRAWVNFDGTTASPSTRRGNGNVSSVTKAGSGNYTVNFSTALPDANYCTVVTSNTNSGANVAITSGIYPSGTYTANGVQVSVQLHANGGRDEGVVCVAVFR